MKDRMIVALVLVLAASALAGCGARRAAAPAAKGTVALPVRVAAATVGDIVQTRKLGGRIVARTVVAVSARFGGRVLSVPVRVGQGVAKGAVLVTLEPRDASAQLEQARASLAQAETANANAAKTFERMKTLFAEGAVSRQQFDQASAEAEAAAARLEQARAAVALARSALQETTVMAPIGGLVANLHAERGEVVAPGQPLLSIEDTDSVYAEVNVGEREVGKLQVGEEVRVAVDALDDGVFTGRIVSIEPSAGGSTRAFLTKVEIANPDHRLRPGMFAEVRLDTDRRRQVVTIPAEAVVDRGDAAVVYVVQGGIARERPVKTGLSDGERVEVAEGLEAGEQVIVAGQNLVSDKTPVTVVQPAGR